MCYVCVSAVQNRRLSAVSGSLYRVIGAYVTAACHNRQHTQNFRGTLAEHLECCRGVDLIEVSTPSSPIRGPLIRRADLLGEFTSSSCHLIELPRRP